MHALWSMLAMYDGTNCAVLCVSVYHFMTNVGHLILWHFGKYSLHILNSHIRTKTMHSPTTHTHTTHLHYFNVLLCLLNSSSCHCQLCHVVQRTDCRALNDKVRDFKLNWSVGRFFDDNKNDTCKFQQFTFIHSTHFQCKSCIAVIVCGVYAHTHT